MKIIACYKLVPEEQDIFVNQDKTLNFSKAEWKIGQYDLNAAESAVVIAESTGGKATALTVGGAITDNSKLKKSVLSRGFEDMYAVVDESLEKSDTYRTSSILAATVKKIGGVDLVICGEGSGDIYSRQVGNILGGLLGWATLNSVSKITPENGKLIVERSVEDGIEVLEVTLPAVLSVTTDINKPRIPGMKDILGAGKKPVTMWKLSDIEGAGVNTSECVSTLAPSKTDRKKIIIQGDGADQVAELYEHLRKELQ